MCLISNVSVIKVYEHLPSQSQRQQAFPDYFAGLADLTTSLSRLLCRSKIIRIRSKSIVLREYTAGNIVFSCISTFTTGNKIKMSTSFNLAPILAPSLSNFLTCMPHIREYLDLDIMCRFASRLHAIDI